MSPHVRCTSPLRCEHRLDGVCMAGVVVLAGHDAHCSHGEELRLREHEEMLRRTRERESRGVKVLDVWKESDPDRDEDEEG